MADDQHARYADPNYRYGQWAGSPKGSAADKSRCRWEVFSDPLFHQCSHKASHDGLWCGTHSPEATARREEKRRARWAAQDQAIEQARQLNKLSEDAVRALVEIASGKLNDPVGYAGMVLSEFDREIIEKALST